MTPDELQFILAARGLSANKAARAIGAASGRTVRRWTAGDREIPAHVALRARRLLAADPYLIAHNPADNREYIVKITPPGFVARVDDGPDAETMALVDLVWLDPQPTDPAELARYIREAGEAMAAYSQNLDLHDD